MKYFLVFLGLVGSMGVEVVRESLRGELVHNKVVISRDEFAEAVYGRTMEEVLEVVGRPDHTSSSQYFDYWSYYERTYDPVAGTIDISFQVWFKNGRCCRAGKLGRI